MSLRRIALRDFVIVQSLDLDLSTGFSVLTGGTGAGKSILLDSLGLALGARADAGLVRKGAEQASVSATFSIDKKHAVHAFLKSHELDSDTTLILRRVLSADGRSRAFINDQPVSVTLLREVGESLVEIQGQHAARGLLETATHRAALDDHGALGGVLAETAEAHRAWRAAAEAEREANGTEEPS